ncbi:hypothetical protein [uncultured Marivita sp.]|uniref:hypothetical protein n=1 Tax=uncultured Marivita sp. TaxID=888080 RepID=UPI0026049B9C|nr:hypothetical protein [uncultured Marivita sp.]
MSHARPSDRYRMAEMKRCLDHATAGQAGSGGDCIASGTSQGEVAFQLGEGGCVQPTD